MVAAIQVVISHSEFSWQYLYQARQVLWMRSAATRRVHSCFCWSKALICLPCITLSRCCVVLNAQVLCSTRDVLVLPLIMRLGRKSLGAERCVLATCSPVRPASTMSLMLSGKPSIACERGVFLEPSQVTGGRGTVAELKGMPLTSFSLGSPRSFTCASRSASRACGGRMVRASVSSKCFLVVEGLRPGPASPTEVAKLRQAFSSDSTHSAASRRTLRCMGSAAWEVAAGTAGREGVELSVSPEVNLSKSPSLVGLRAVAVLGFTFVIRCDFCSTASALRPKVSASG
mmetsp:Transcript_137880/g.326672  ORF Transcript_137880/g.326672 Transcript_137880/m.326672 type:complete len:287 (-) Transcript_137880:575-1435(-)